MRSTELASRAGIVAQRSSADPPGAGRRLEKAGTHRSSVVFPAPFGPNSARQSPAPSEGPPRVDGAAATKVPARGRPRPPGRWRAGMRQT
jgi:hypothetical protein